MDEKRGYVLKKKRCITAFLFGLCLLFTACGEEAAVQPFEEESSSLTWEDIVDRNGVVDQDKQNQWLGIDSSEIETSGDGEEEVPENVILIAALSKDYANLYKAVTAFNKSQSKYKAEVKRYENRDSMFLDLVRGKGCDILALTPTYLTTLADKGALEDLTPYFEDSEAVSKDDLFSCMWETCAVGGRMVGVFPSFYVTGILVEKGYTEEGAWTIDEYLSLMDKYPDVPLSDNAVPETGGLWAGTELAELPEAYVDWEERTCDFENAAFIEMIEKLKDYLWKGKNSGRNKNDIFGRAESLYQRQVQTLEISFGYGRYFSDYKMIRDTFLDAFELAGCPTQDKTVKYPIVDVGGTCTYSINAASPKKDGAWKVLEYMLSEKHQQTIADAGRQDFPMRRDIVEKMLDEEIAADPEDMSYGYMNSYTGEKVRVRGEFTEEDKESVLYILDHAVPPAIMSSASSNEIRRIYRSEIDAFFQGDKTAEETAHILQNRISLYLSE